MTRFLGVSLGKRIARPWGLLVIVLALASCTVSQSSTDGQVAGSTANPGANPGESSTASSAKEPNSPKKVLTTFTILADMAQNVAGDALTVESITRIGAEIHGYEPVPSDIAKAQNADLILYNGMDLERWLEQFLRNVDDVPAAILSEGITPIAIATGPYADKPNPHAWMSPQNALVYVENIRQAFVDLDPANADIYNANAAAYSQSLEAIDQALQAALAALPPTQRYLVTCEGAFSYLARDYGLKEIYIWPINAEQQSTPKQLKAVIEQVKANNVPTVFCESTVSDEAQKQIAQATGAMFGGNLYVDSLSTPTGPVPTFLDLLQYDADVITDGLIGRES
ncbi:MAG: metal ABC transporter substrate-binding protein [Phormidesmis sp. RL_2_1]|nr:metal ABC transporter substrate-binding protein [Phormidesmis sp. RL_2_1]